MAVLGPMNEAYASVLSPECIDFVAHLARSFGPRRDQLLARRRARQQEFDQGGNPKFLEDTRHIRESDWQVQLPTIWLGDPFCTRHISHIPNVQLSDCHKTLRCSRLQPYSVACPFRCCGLSWRSPILEFVTQIACAHIGSKRLPHMPWFSLSF